MGTARLVLGSEGVLRQSNVENLNPELTVTGMNHHCGDENLAGQHSPKQQVNRKRNPLPPPLVSQSVTEPNGDLWLAKDK